MAAYQEIKEGKAVIHVPRETKISAKLPVFYNPVMAQNRDLSVLLLKALDRKGLQIGLPLAGSGIRGIRFLRELPSRMVSLLAFNDHSRKAAAHIRANLRRNKLSQGALAKVQVSNRDANAFFLGSKGFDYIDLDPFGTPNPFLDAAINRLAREGILAVTATDTAPLSGTYPHACRRKYWAKPLKNEFMHETGLRILIRKVQLIGAQYDKALSPLFSYSTDHYFRVFFINHKGKTKVDALFTQHRHVAYDPESLSRRLLEPASLASGKSIPRSTTGVRAPEIVFGPLYSGPLFDHALVLRMLELIPAGPASGRASSGTPGASAARLGRFLHIIALESRLGFPLFYDVHRIAKCHHLAHLPTMKEVFRKLRKAGCRTAPTHFSPTGFLCDKGIEVIRKALS
ncbi:MAG: tRNA (guanine(10)-N(2))-dimethyltransferase [DPANN group archaeon]|nr:tRNA (guanine(10)-N(2))-dimethyltransferase [DPANN group archaeon]